MKKRYGFICLGLSLVLLFSGCNNSKKYEDSIKDITKETGEQSTKHFFDFEIDTNIEPYQSDGRIAVTEDGIFYNPKFFGRTNGDISEWPWHFYNVHTGEDTVMCSKIDCKHTDRNTCEGFFNNYHYYGNYENPYLEVEDEYAETNCVYYKNRLYAAKYDYREGTKIVSYDSTGNDMKVEAVVEEDPSYVFSDKFRISNNKGIVVFKNYKENNCKIVVVNLSDAKSETIYTKSLVRYVDKKYCEFSEQNIYNGVYFFSMLEGTEYKLYSYNLVTGKLDIALNFNELEQFLSKGESISGYILKDGKMWFNSRFRDEEGNEIKNKRDICSYDMQTKEFRHMGLNMDGMYGYTLFDADDQYIYLYMQTFDYSDGEKYAEAFEDGKLGEDVKLPGLQVYDINTSELVYECEYRKNINEKLKEYFISCRPYYAEHMSDFYVEVLVSRTAQMKFMGLDDRYVYFTVSSSSFDPTGVDDTIPYNGCIGLRIDSISEQNPEWVWLWREYSGAQW